MIAILTIFLLTSGAWLGSRVYLQLMTMRSTPRLYNSLFLTQIKRYQNSTRFMFTDEPVYSFHAGIPLPPSLADISLKRLWSGDMTNAKLAAQLAEIKPGVILVANNGVELPYQELLQEDYRLIYQDAGHLLYALKTIRPQEVP